MKPWFLALGLFFTVQALGLDVIDRALKDCKDDHVCFVKVAGTQCADGTPSGYSVTYRPGATKLFLFLEGGGACWSKETCEKGTALHLTAPPVYEGPYNSQTDLEGWGILTNPNNPIAQGYHIVRVPYCTGDIFIGDKDTDYGTPDKPYLIRHRGYRNLGLVLKEVVKRFPNPDSLLFMGISAGGLGATWNVHQVRETWPQTKMHVINDGGLAFKTPAVSSNALSNLYEVWGADTTNPAQQTWARTLEDLATAVIRYNQQTYPDVPFAFISAYKDWIMTMFAKLLHAPNFTTAVKQIMIELADNEFTNSPNYRVFYLEDFWHGYAKKDPAQVKSKGVRLDHWVRSMLADLPTWENVRPDKSWH